MHLLFEIDILSLVFAFLCSALVVVLQIVMGQLGFFSPIALPLLSRDPLYHVLFLAVILLTSAGYVLKPKRQKYAMAPIACVEGTTLAAARERFRTDARGMLREGNEKYKGRPFYVPSPLGERLLIPSKYVEELKTAPVDEVDFVGTFFEVRCSNPSKHFR